MAYSRRFLFGLAAATFMAASIPARSACPPDYPKNLPCPQEPWETVELEHRDRTQRLLRLAAGTLSFEFSEEHISPTKLGLPDFPEGLPVLRVVAGQDVFFDSDRDVIRPEAYRLLDIIASSLKLEPPDVALFVAGHTDSDADDAYNIELGLRRAQRVAEALAKRGIYQTSIYRVSFGELMPIDTNETERGKARNRRVEFLFSARPKAIVEFIVQQPVAVCAEALDDPLGSCKLPIRIEAERIEVPQEYHQEIVDLDAESAAVDLDSSLSSIEVLEKKKEIEADRERIPIVITSDRVPIDLTRQ